MNKGLYGISKNRTYEPPLSASYATTSVTSSYPIKVSGYILTSADVSTTSLFLGNGAGFGSNVESSNFIGVQTGQGATNANYSNFLGNVAGQNATNAYYSNFLGLSAGIDAANASYSNFLGYQAGYQAANASYSNFLGISAGYQATNAGNSNFLGINAGYQATNAGNSNFLGGVAGYLATNAGNSNFLGNGAGFVATNAQFSNFLGINAGYQAASASNSNFLGYQAGYQALNAYRSNFLGDGTGYGATNANDSNFLGSSAGTLATSASNSNFLGNNAGTSATNANSSNFIGTNTGLLATNANNSNFLGTFTGYQATNANNSNFLGNNAGYSASNAAESNFIGTSTGTGATNANNSNFLGSYAGRQATNANYSNFIGNNAGYLATDANSSNFIGSNAGYQATNANYSNFIGGNAGYSASNAAGSNFIGGGAGAQATNAYSSNFIGGSAGYSASNAYRSNFLGYTAGYQATNANSSNFLGPFAGNGATNAINANFLGPDSGELATNANNSNFLGNSTGFQAANASNSNFLGNSTGFQATNASNSNFLGYQVGFQATSASNSNFIGVNAGTSATNANNSNFLGRSAGRNATSASLSTLIGYQVGYNVAGGALGIKSNNIIIGTNITLPNNAINAINLGGILFGTGSYSTTSGNPFSGSANGRIGINVVDPTYSFEVSGTVAFRDLTNSSTATKVVLIDNNGQLYTTASSGIGGGGIPGGPNTSIQFNNNGTFSGSSNFTFVSASNIVSLTGSMRFAPTSDPDPTGANVSASYLFMSSSNTALGNDLYFRQDGNLVKWKWIEGALSTGLLYGGVLSYNNSSSINIAVSSGSGIIVSPNANVYSEVNPQIKYVTWGNLSASIATGSAQATYVYIDQYGSLQTQNDFFTPEQYASNIPLGMFNHTGRNLITSVTGDVYTTYNTTNQSFDFIQAFGPLKISGTTISGQTGTLRLNVSSGESYILGGFYQQDPNNISHKQTSAYLTASIARVYRSGSTFVTDNNNGSFYTTVDPNNWDNGTGTLTAVGGGSYSIQRVFFNPATGRCHVYYGQNKYNTLAEATTNISTEAFSEAIYSSHQYVLAAYLVLKGNTVDLNNTENTVVQAGLFRNTVGSAGGTVIPAKLTDLGDVSISTPTQGQALIYDAGTTKWVNGTPVTASYVTGSVFTSTNLALSASSALTASYVNTLNQSVIVSGSLTVSGSTVVRSTLGTGAAFQVLSGSSPILYAGTNISQTRVGIRTSTPLYSFDVNGNANFTPEEHSGYLRISPGQSSTWNNPTFFQTSFGSTLMLNNAYYTASSGQFIRATNGYAAGIQLEPSLGGIELFTAPYGTAGTSFASFTSRITITNSGSVGINNTSPSYSLDVSGSGNYSNGLTVTGSTAIQALSSQSPFQISSGSASLLFVSSSGNIGLNRTAPNAKLHIADSGSFGGIHLENLTTASLGVPQSTPSIRLTGYSYQSPSSSINQWLIYGTGTSGAGYSHTLNFGSVTAGLSQLPMTLTQNGSVAITNAMSAFSYSTVGGVLNLGSSAVAVYSATSRASNSTGRSLYLRTNLNTVADDGVYINNATTLNISTGTQNAVTVNDTVAYTTGTGSYNAINVPTTVSQSAAASGSTVRGLYINPTFTNLAGTYRAIEVNTGSLVMNDTYLASGSLSGSLIDLSQTWNTAGTVTGIKLNVTDTASNGASLFMALQVGGTNRITFSKIGGAVFTSGVGIGSVSSVSTFQNNASKGLVIPLQSGFFDGGTIATTSGTANYASYYSANTHNLTGTWSGTTRGIYLTPTITSLASGSYVAIESTQGGLVMADTYVASGSRSGSLIDLSQTWNTTGNPTAIKLNVTNTASGATSKLIDLQVGGVSQFSISKTGSLTATGQTKIGTSTYVDPNSTMIIGKNGSSAAARGIITADNNYQDFGFVKTNIAAGNINSWQFGQRYDTFFGNATGSFQIIGSYTDNSGNGSAVGGGYRVPIICNPDGTVIIAGASANSVNGNVLVGTATDAGFKLDVSGSTRINGQLITTGSINLATGSITLSSGSITMPNRPAFRVTGAGGGKTAVTVLSGSYLNVDYQQGGGWDNATGTFTAPIAGLYQVDVVVRTNSNSLGTISQLIVYKNNTTGTTATGTPQIMIEFNSNTSMNHAGGSTISKLAVGDTLKMLVAVGEISFDSNDNFSVAYIG